MKYLKAGPEYNFFIRLLKVYFLMYFKRIYGINYHLLPKDKPVIIAANHSNALLDPILLAPFLDRPLHFITRGDLFKKGFIANFFYRVNMLPIYRIRDGYAALNRNEETFNKCHDLLNEKKVIVIFIEGDCEQDRRLRTLKKGTARMAYGAIEKYGFDIDIQIVPIGINYTYHTKARKDVMIRFSEPIPLKKFEETYKKNSARGIKAFNKEVGEAMKKNIIHLNSKDSDELLEHLLIMHRNHEPLTVFPLMTDNPKRLDLEIGIANRLNELHATAIDEHKALEEKAESYFEALDDYDVWDLGILEKHKNNLFRGLWLLLTFPLFIIGYGVNILPIYIAKKIADQKMKSPIFYASFAFTASMIFHAVYSLIILIILVVIFGWYGLLASVVILLLGGFSLIHLDYQSVWRTVFSANRLKRKDPKAFETLKKTRAEIVEKVGVSVDW